MQKELFSFSRIGNPNAMRLNISRTIKTILMTVLFVVIDDIKVVLGQT